MASRKKFKKRKRRKMMTQQDNRTFVVGTTARIADQTVFSTADLSVFKLFPNNRPIDIVRAEKIAQEIREGKNYLRQFPIIVDREFNIIDGQHRWKAAQFAGVEVYFVISDTMTMEEAANAVRLTKGWTIKDTLHHHIVSGNEEYIKLNNFWRNYPWMSITTLIRLCSTSGYRSVEFKDGQYKSDRLKFARTVAEMIADFKAFHDGWNTSAFINALAQLAGNPSYSHRRMLQKISYQSTKLRRNGTVQLYLDNMSEIYNYRENEKNHVYFRQVTRITPLEKD